MTKKEIAALGRAVTAMSNARTSLDDARYELKAAGGADESYEAAALRDAVQELLTRINAAYEQNAAGAL